jgi:predicted DNA-binding protein (UPF0251 family)
VTSKAPLSDALRLLAMRRRTAQTKVFEGRRPHRPSSVGLTELGQAADTYAIVQIENPDWKALKCQHEAARRLNISVHTLRERVTAARNYTPGTHRRVGGMGPKKKRST